MKILIVTQSVDLNDSILGFFHRWIEEFSKYFEKVTVICLYKGKYNLPSNVKILSLGREAGKSKIAYLFNFYKYVWQERDNYNLVFVHMNPIYIILGGMVWRLIGKKIALWYAHKNADWKLRLAEKMTNIIFTASKESFRLSSKKLRIVGHGINTDLFKPMNHSKGEYLQIVSIARISKTKNQQVMVEAISLLKERGVKVKLHIVGPALSLKDKLYESKIREFVKNKNLINDVIFYGSMSSDGVPHFLGKMDLFINLSDTGSLDKAILEAMSCNVKVLTSNQAFKGFLSEEYLTKNIPEVIVSNILNIRYDQNLNLREEIKNNHNLKNLIEKISLQLNQI